MIPLGSAKEYATMRAVFLRWPLDADENAAAVHLAKNHAPQQNIGDRVPERRRFGAAARTQPRHERAAIGDPLERSAARGHAREEAVEPDGKEIGCQRISSVGRERPPPGAPLVYVHEPVKER